MIYIEHIIKTIPYGWKLLFASCFFLFFSYTCSTLSEPISCDLKVDKRVKGVTFTAPAKPFPENPMPPIQAVNAEWIAVIPYGFTRPGKADVSYNIDWQWWGEKEEGAKTTIQLAQEAGLNVMLKPQVYLPGSWPGDLEFKTDRDWLAWEGDYENYILTMARLADSMQVAMFCIGTEFDKSVAQRPQFWEALIAKVRKTYTGKLTYSANWDKYMNIPFWDKLDYIGISAYFPLVDSKTPDVKELQKAWQPYTRQIGKLACKVNKPVLFTEYGYLSVDRCAYNTWELEPNVHSLPVNEQAQANAIRALLEELKRHDWWAGGFIWKWFPNGAGGEGYDNRDYTPQNKIGEDVLKTCYGEM